MSKNELKAVLVAIVAAVLMIVLWGNLMRKVTLAVEAEQAQEESNE